MAARLDWGMPESITSELSLTECIQMNWEYWDKQVQIDVVGLRHDNWIDLGECKWGSVPSVPQLIAEVEAKVKPYPNKDNATLGRLVFTRRRVKAPKAWTTTRFLSLEDLYSMG